MKQFTFFRQGFILLIALSISVIVSAQTGVSINATGAAPNANAILDVSSTTKGALLPRMTTAQRIAFVPTGLSGMTVYDTTTQTYWYWDGTANLWRQMPNTSSIVHNTLDGAYDQGGAGAGRVITADAGAVDIQGSGGLLVNGNVGIGAAGTDKLHLQNTGGNTSMRIGYSPSYVDNLIYFGEGTDVYVGEKGLDDRLYLYGRSLSIDINGDLGASGSVLKSNGSTVSWQPDLGITGTGTLNYLARWTGATTLGIGATFDNGTSVGIGTSTPDAQSLLDLNSATRGVLFPRLTTAQRGAIGQGTNTDYGLWVYNTSTARYNYWDGTAWQDVATLGSIATSFIQNQYASSQTVGEYWVSGRGRMDGGLTVGTGATIDNNNTNVGTVTSGSLSFGNASGEGMGSKRSAGGNQNGLDFYTAAVNRMAITNAGNVGVGTTTPNQKLQVNGIARSFGNFMIDVDGANAAGPRIAFGTNTNEYAYMNMGSYNNMNQIETTSRDFRVGSTSATNALYIQNTTGNVGMGTSTPYANLNVGSPNGASIYLTREAGTINANDVLGSILFDGTAQTSPSTVDAGAVIRATASQGLGNSNKGAYLTFMTKNNVAQNVAATERMRITANGNVGIGTSNPDGKLDVTGNASGIAGIKVANSANAAHTWIPFTNGSIYLTGDRDAGAGDLFFRSFSTAGSYVTHMSITASTGNVTVTNLGTGLVKATSGVLSIAAGSDLPSGSGNYVQNQNASAQTANFFVSGTGRTNGTLIGGGATTISSDNIQVNDQGTGNRFSYIDLQGDDTYTDYGLRLIRGNTGLNTTSTLTHRGTGDLSIHTNEAAAITFSTTNTERMRVLSNGNIGIGIATPLGRLDVQGPVARTATHATSPSFYVTGTMGTGQTGSAAGNIEFRHDNGSQGIGFGYNTIYQAGSNPNQDLNLIAKGSSHLTLQAYNGVTGNVGIATTAPAQKLHVVGNARISGLSAGGNVQANASGDLIISNDLPAGDSDYIHNQFSVDQSASYRISGAASATNYQVNHGFGNVLKVGDDAWISDVNASNMMGVTGQANPAHGGFRLGNNAAAYVYSDGSANIGIGTTTPGQKLEVNGNISLPSSTGNKQIYTWSAGDNNWRIGMSATPGFARSLATSHVEYATFASGAGQGFAVGDNVTGLSSFEVTGSGSGYNAFFRGNVGIGTNPSNPLHVVSSVSTSTIYALNTISNPNNVSSIYGYLSSGGSGSGYGHDFTRSSVKGYAYFGYAYTYGVSGYRYDDGFNRGGGVFGGSSQGNAPTAWGSLGYKGSNNVHYGVYGSNAYASGGGYLPTASSTGIGGGFAGGVVGSWSSGEVMGQVSKGDLFASYNLGNEYTSGFQADIVNVGDSRVAAYSLTSNDVKVYGDGEARLNGTSVFVPFEVGYAQLLGTRPRVTITAIGSSAAIYIQSVDITGFTVASDASVNVEFYWISVGKRIDAHNKPELPVDIANKNFDANMKGVMFNESNSEQSATPVWWDGTRVRFDAAPEAPKEPKIESVNPGAQK